MPVNPSVLPHDPTGRFTVFTHGQIKDNTACGFHEPIGQPPARYVVPSTKSLESTNAEDHPRFRD